MNLICFRSLHHEGIPELVYSTVSNVLTNTRENYGILKGLRLQNGGEVTRPVKYADGLMLLAKEETVLKGMIERLNKIRRCDGMEINVERAK
jgi:Fic family protein